MTKQLSLTAETLKQILWQTLQELKNNKCSPEQANAVACQGREILRATKVQLQVSSLTGRDVPKKVINFSEK